ncbi:MAG: CCA tRNA nucleotidyltransferase [Phycisphaera sp.]|nr:CCA tRNA nucleotidyltransferase [Phycisphaera sp.]
MNDHAPRDGSGEAAGDALRAEPRERLPLADAARAVAGRILDAGFETYFAGGCVRDRLLGAEPKDYDIATAALPDEIRGIFPKARGVGEAFGVVLVRHGGHSFEVATFREDGPYHDGRRPSEVRYSTAREDALRRDFTANGLFENPRTGEVVDFVEGRADIAARLLRAIGDPHERIREDRLRMLRAPRFAARLAFELEPRTAEAIRAHADELASVSPERVGDELRRMLAHHARGRAVALIEALGLDGAVFGSRAPMASRRRVDALSAHGAAVPAGGWTTVLAAWWLDRAAGEGAEALPVAATRAEMERGLRRRLVLSNHESDAFASALDCREALLGPFRTGSIPFRARLIARAGFDAALALVAAEDPGLGAALAAEADRELPARALPPPLVDGDTLVRAGYRPGPRFKRWLDLAMDAQLEGRVRSTEEALQLVATAAAEGDGRGGGA